MTNQSFGLSLLGVILAVDVLIAFANVRKLLYYSYFAYSFYRKCVLILSNIFMYLLISYSKGNKRKK